MPRVEHPQIHAVTFMLVQMDFLKRKLSDTRTFSKVFQQEFMDIIHSMLMDKCKLLFAKEHVYAELLLTTIIIKLSLGSCHLMDGPQIRHQTLSC